MSTNNSGVKVVLTLDSIVKHEDGSDYFAIDASLIDYANKSLNSCNEKCSSEVKVKAHFIASSNSESKYFKVWHWVGVLTLGIIPVYEKTNFTLVADVQTVGNTNIRLSQSRHLVLSIVLLPFNIFRNWREDLLAPQKMLIDRLVLEITTNRPVANP